MPKVSVIIPVYGVENYIARCARSLFEQTLEDMEFVFVDDHSLDKSIDVLKEVLSLYPDRLQQVKIVSHKKNQGLPTARKTGLLHATGEYIAHCDSDDWVDHSLYESMYNSALMNNADISVCDFKVHRQNKIEVKIGTRVNNIETYKLNLLFQLNSVSMVNKLIRREIYQNSIEFPTLNMGEDMATTLQLIRFCRTMSFVEGVCYHYDGTTTSITRKETKNATLDRAMQACTNVQLVLNAYKGDDREEVKDGLTHLKFMQRKQLMPIINHKDVYAIWKKTFPEINRDVVFKKTVQINFYERLKFFLTLINVFPIIKDLTRKNLD